MHFNRIPEQSAIINCNCFECVCASVCVHCPQSMLRLTMWLQLEFTFEADSHAVCLCAEARNRRTESIFFLPSAKTIEFFPSSTKHQINTDPYSCHPRIDWDEGGNCVQIDFVSLCPPTHTTQSASNKCAVMTLSQASGSIPSMWIHVIAVCRSEWCEIYTSPMSNLPLLNWHDSGDDGEEIGTLGSVICIEWWRTKWSTPIWWMQFTFLFECTFQQSFVTHTYTHMNRTMLRSQVWTMLWHNNIHVSNFICLYGTLRWVMVTILYYTASRMN